MHREERNLLDTNCLLMPPDWDHALNNISKTTMFKILDQHARLYQNDDIGEFAPKKIQRVFNCFDNCLFSTLRLVVVKRPVRIRSTFNGTSMGICKSKPRYSECVVERNFISILQKNFGSKTEVKKLSFDTLAYQGILFLPTVHTSRLVSNAKEIRLQKRVTKLWELFNIEVIKAISEKKEGISFLFIGEDSYELIQYVDGTKHSSYFTDINLNLTNLKLERDKILPIHSAINRAITIGKKDFIWA